jgi:hypothetical protein
MAGSCEHDNKTSCAIKGGGISEQMSALLGSQERLCPTS